MTNATVNRQRSLEGDGESADGGPMTNRDQPTLTLRAKCTNGDLTPGTLIASPKGRVVYRILEVWRVRRAGNQRCALRLVLSRLGHAEVPEGAEVLPWPCDPRAPRAGRTTGHRQRQSPGSAPPEAIRQDRLQQRAEQLARARRVGCDAGLVKSSDYGPGIRLELIRAHNGVVLRDADVTVGDAPDPHVPKRTIRRARRSDHLLTLLREGTIDQRQADGGELLRNAIERSQPSVPNMFRSEVHVAPRDRVAISERQLEAGRCVRRALAVLDNVVAPAVLWIVRDGGTVRGYAAFAHVAHTTVAKLLRRGLGALADHYRLARPRAA